MKIGILSVKDETYHPNNRLLMAAREKGHFPFLLNPYTVIPQLLKGKPILAGLPDGSFPDLIFPRQGAQVGESSLALIRQLSLMGIPMVNSFESILLARNQYFTLQALAGAGVAVPDSCFINDLGKIIPAMVELGGYPVVAKTMNGRQGEGVFLLASEEEAKEVISRFLEPSAGLLVQRFIPPEGRLDYRVLVIGGRVAAAMALHPSPGEFRSNIHLNSRASRAAISDSLAGMAVKASKTLGLDVSGVDMVVDAGGRAWVLEINYSPGFRGLESVTGMDIAGMIIDHGVS